MAQSLLRVDVAEIITARRLGRLHLAVVLLLGLALGIAGFCVEAMAAAASALAQGLGVASAALDRAILSGGVGAIVGMLAFGPIADRLGRKPTILFATMVLALAGFGTAFAPSATLIVALRFVAGLAVGAMLPASLALAAEFMPQRHQILGATVVWLGYAIGASAASPLVALMLTRYPWHFIFALAGLAPLAVAPLLWMGLPESLLVMVRRGERAAPEVRQTLMRISRRYDFLRTTEFVSSEPDEPGSPVALLFGSGRAPIVVLLWVSLALALAAATLFKGVAASALASAGLAPGATVAWTVLMGFAGFAGALALAPTAEKLGRFAVLAAALALGALAALAMSLGAVALVASFVAGFVIVGAGYAAAGIVAASYPTALRATGVGWALAAGFAGALAASGLASARVLPVVAAAGLAAVASYTIAASGRRFGGEPLVAEKSTERAAQSFHGVHYLRHNARRQEHLATLGLDLAGKRVLEVGAGVGDHTSFFLDRGCSVLSTEPRPENIKVFEKMLSDFRAVGYARAAACTLMTADVEDIGKRVDEVFDVVYCYGLLYHVSDPASTLSILAKRCGDLFLLETCVSFGDHEAINLVSEQQAVATQSYEGQGCRPTRPWIMSRLKELFPYVYMPRTQPAHEEFPLDWGAPPSTNWLTRAVFVASRRPLDNPMLLDTLPRVQERC